MCYGYRTRPASIHPVTPYARVSWFARGVQRDDGRSGLGVPLTLVSYCRSVDCSTDFAGILEHGVKIEWRKKYVNEHSFFGLFG